MNGKIVGGGIVAFAVLAGVSLYYLQVYHFYERLDPSQVQLVVTASDGDEAPLSVQNLLAIDATSSPIRFRACAELSEPPNQEAFAPYEGAEPLTAPGWFDCFDATEIGEALTAGRAQAYLSQADVAIGVDRVLAIFDDGRVLAWHQLNPDFDT